MTKESFFWYVEDIKCMKLRIIENTKAQFDKQYAIKICKISTNK